MTTTENLKKSGRFADLVLVYQQRCDLGEDDETTLTDILADVMHWCDTQGLDFDYVVGLARVHYEAEIAGEE